MAVPFPFKVTPAEIYNLADRARAALALLSKTVLDGAKPPPGPYAFFHHNAHAMARIDDCCRIVERLFNEVHELVRLALERDRVEPPDWPAGVPYPEAMQSIFRSEQTTNSYAQLDVESLYVFGAVLLDQWALITAAVGQANIRKESPFIELINEIEQDPGALHPVWTCCREDMLWLSYQLRLYRNKFIVHANRPWQRGTTRTVYGEEYNLFTPTPPGWLNDDDLNNRIMKLLRLAPEYVRATPDENERTPARLIETLFDKIADLPTKADRESVASLYSQKGGSTPTFQLIALRLFRLIAEGTDELAKIAATDPSRVDLGMPYLAAKKES